VTTLGANGVGGVRHRERPTLGPARIKKTGRRVELVIRSNLEDRDAKRDASSAVQHIRDVGDPLAGQKSKTGKAAKAFPVFAASL